MTPNELLESVKARFVVLLHDEPVKLEALLVQAIGEYQERAGVVFHVPITKEENDKDGIDLPAHFLEVVTAEDSLHAWHEAVIANGKVKLLTDKFSKAPFNLRYLVNLRDYDLDTDKLPNECIGLIQKYLYALIDLPNTERTRQVNEGAGLANDQLPGASELTERLRTIEQEMIDRAALLEPALVM